MSDEIHRFQEQQHSLRQMPETYDELQSRFTHHLGVKNSLEKELSALAIAQVEFKRHRNMLLGSEKGKGIYEIASEIVERERKLLEEARRLRLFDTQSVARILKDAALESQQAIEEQRAFERRFYLPTVSELNSIAREAKEIARGYSHNLLDTHALQTAMASMHSPWLQIDKSLASATAFSEIIAMGRGIKNRLAFDRNFAARLRPNLGDWREMFTPPTEQLIDPMQRASFYLDKGLDPKLIDFTQPAFDECLEIAGLRDPEENVSADSQEEYSKRAKKAFDILQRFEIALRRFIVQVMHSTYGNDWMKRQLPPTMLAAWVEKKEKAVKAGQAEELLIEYADFSDYKAIIERSDNWKSIFKNVFVRQEDVRESLQRLYPIRIATMHARHITSDDELLMVVETKRVLNAIGQT